MPALVESRAGGPSRTAAAAAKSAMPAVQADQEGSRQRTAEAGRKRRGRAPGRSYTQASGELKASRSGGASGTRGEVMT